MRVAVTGATGLIGTRLVGALVGRGDDVVVLSRDPDRARRLLGGEARAPGGGRGGEGAPAVEAVAWDPVAGPAPAAVLSGADAVVNLAGENIAQRWTGKARRAIRDSRELGTRNLVVGLRGADPRPVALVSASAVGYYGSRGDERVDEATTPGTDFLAQVCVAWEREAEAARAIGVRVTVLRTGVVLDAAGGALAKMLPPFRLGVGGPVAGGGQYMPWIHVDDLVGLYLAALDDDRFSRPVNACAPEPVTNHDFSKALGRALGRPAVLPVPGLALKLLYGDMALVVTDGQRAIPARALELGYEFAHPDLDEALADALRASA